MVKTMRKGTRWWDKHTWHVRRPGQCQNKLIWILHLRLLTPPTLPLSYTCPLLFLAPKNMSQPLSHVFTWQSDTPREFQPVTTMIMIKYISMVLTWTCSSSPWSSSPPPSRRAKLARCWYTVSRQSVEPRVLFVFQLHNHHHTSRTFYNQQLNLQGTVKVMMMSSLAQFPVPWMAQCG